jgi:DDE superfamily endonuclease
MVEIKAIACELPVTLGLPLSRLSVADVARHAQRSGLVASISDSTVWRWFHEDAIRPWQHRCWIFPRDPHFQAKAGRILDLYERRWQGQALRDDECVISTDEKTSIQARLRIHPSLPTEPGKSMRVEHECARGGAWAYLAALDVHRAKVFGRCEATTGIAPFKRLVEQVMSQAPYNTARRVFWLMDNGSSHRGEASVRRITQAHPTSAPVHGPVHASWLNQIEIYFSIVQRKVLPAKAPHKNGVTECSFAPAGPCLQLRVTPPAVIVEIDRLLNDHTDAQIAAILNARGMRPGAAASFHRQLVARLAPTYRLKPRFERLRERGLPTLQEMADKLQVTPLTVKIWRRRGLVRGHAYRDKNECLYEPPGDDAPSRAQGIKLSLRRVDPQFAPDRAKEVQYEA